VLPNYNINDEIKKIKRKRMKVLPENKLRDEMYNIILILYCKEKIRVILQNYSLLMTRKID